MKAVTYKQQEILEYVLFFLKNNKMPPTIAEISQHFGIQPATAFAHVRALQKKGLLTRSSKARSLKVSSAKEKPSHFSMSLNIPILGRISAGPTIFSEECIEGSLNVDRSTLPSDLGHAKLFALKVHGESMRDLGILDGDVIVVKQETVAEPGQIIVAMLEDGETTVKSLYRAGEQWELRPANPDFKSRFVPLDELNVQGIVVALQRKYA